MMLRRPRNAGLISVVLALVILSVCYAVVGTVDVIFMRDGRQIARQDNVSAISEFEMPEGTFSLDVDGVNKTVSSADELKDEVLTVVVTNFLGFKWQEKDNIIVVIGE